MVSMDTWKNVVNPMPILCHKPRFLGGLNPIHKNGDFGDWWNDIGFTMLMINAEHQLWLLDHLNGFGEPGCSCATVLNGYMLFIRFYKSDLADELIQHHVGWLLISKPNVNPAFYFRRRRRQLVVSLRCSKSPWTERCCVVSGGAPCHLCCNF